MPVFQRFQHATTRDSQPQEVGSTHTDTQGNQGKNGTLVCTPGTDTWQHNSCLAQANDKRRNCTAEEECWNFPRETTHRCAVIWNTRQVLSRVVSQNGGNQYFRDTYLFMTTSSSTASFVSGGTAFILKHIISPFISLSNKNDTCESEKVTRTPVTIDEAFASFQVNMFISRSGWNGWQFRIFVAICTFLKCLRHKSLEEPLIGSHVPRNQSLVHKNHHLNLLTTPTNCRIVVLRVHTRAPRKSVVTNTSRCKQRTCVTLTRWVCSRPVASCSYSRLSADWWHRWLCSLATFWHRFVSFLSLSPLQWQSDTRSFQVKFMNDGTHTLVHVNRVKSVLTRINSQINQGKPRRGWLLVHVETYVTQNIVQSTLKTQTLLFRNSFKLSKLSDTWMNCGHLPLPKEKPWWNKGIE